MAAYNSAPYIKEAINSVLNQTFTDFELIILNDGSTDHTAEIINTFSDKRIRLIHNDYNQGLVFTRNRLLDLARAEFIAVLDSDDVADPERLELQYQYMTAHPEISLCGGHAQIIDSEGRLTGEKFIQPVADEYDFFMLFGSMFVNSASIFKKSHAQQVGGYRDYAPAEDFDLFMRIATIGRIKNLDSILVSYRIHSTNTSTQRKEIQRKNELRLIANMQADLDLVQTEENLKLHLELFSHQYNRNHFEGYGSLLINLKYANRKSKRYPIRAFEAFLFNKWNEIINSVHTGKAALPLLLRKGLFKWSLVSLKQLRRAFKQSLKAYFR